MLLDTGALVAILDRSERNHLKCVEFLKGYHGRFVTTEPVLTEAMYLLGHSVSAQRACIDFILRGGAILMPSSSKSLKRCIRLMERLSNIPMDFADATLVVLAEEMGVNSIFTLDRKDFSVYRVHRRVFEIFP
jgi:hypothetical protein